MAWSVEIDGLDKTPDVGRAIIVSGAREGGEATLEVRGLNPASFAPVVITRAGVNLFRGQVGPLTTPHDGTSLLEGDLRCHDQTTALRYILVSGSYEGTASGIAEAVLAEYAPHLARSIVPIDLALSFKYNYLSLLEVLRGISQAAGAHFTTNDGTVYLYRQSWGMPITLELDEVATPYDYSKDPSELVNDVYVIGGVSRAPYEQTWTADGGTIFTFEQHGLLNIAVTVNGVPQNLAPEGFTAPESAEVFLSLADRQLRFKEAPAPGATIVLEAEYDYTVMERIEDVASVQVYGRLQRVINDTAILNKATARAMGRNALQSQPKEILRCDLIDFQPITAGRKLYLAWLERYGVVTQSTITLDSDETVRLEVELL